jgi:hypothetical protein
MVVPGPVRAGHETVNNNWLRAYSRWERHLNSVWNDTLTPSMRDALRVEERKWIAWKDSLPLDALTGAIICGNMPASIIKHVYRSLIRPVILITTQNSFISSD